jgi:hypothetical protein
LCWLDSGHSGWKREGEKRKKATSRRRDHDQSKMGPQVYFWKRFEKRLKMIRIDVNYENLCLEAFFLMAS